MDGTSSRVWYLEEVNRLEEDLDLSLRLLGQIVSHLILIIGSQSKGDVLLKASIIK